MFVNISDSITFDNMELDSDAEMPSAGPSGGAGKVCEKKRFEVKKWNAVALWAWDIVVDNCAICRNHIMDLCIECQANQVSHNNNNNNSKLLPCKL